MNKHLYGKIYDYMCSCAEETAHDRDHVCRVLNYALKIASAEREADYDILIAAALLHDIGRGNKKQKHDEAGAKAAGAFLETTEFPSEKIDAVRSAIENHSTHGRQESLEAIILYDADKLDAIGVMGVARALIGVGNYNNPAYCLKDGRADLNENSETDTFVRYYLRRISKTAETFYTKQAKALAENMKGEAESFFSAFIDTVNKNAEYHNELYKAIEYIK